MYFPIHLHYTEYDPTKLIVFYIVTSVTTLYVYFS